MTWPGESLHSLHGQSLVVSDGEIGEYATADDLMSPCIACMDTQPAAAGDLVSPSITDDLVSQAYIYKGGH